MQNSSHQPGAERHHSLGLAVGLLAVITLTVICYWPSLSGPFVFDDIPNLEPIGARGGLVSAENYFEFIRTSRAGPLGRPLSQASFALNADTWPADPRPFRITNLLLHLVNGILLFAVTRRIFLQSGDRRTAGNLALMCAALWLLHPLLVSTTAYIIQRMTLLCTLFTLAGLLCYLRGRTALPTDSARGWRWIIAGIGGFGLLAILSKETGILLALYALVIELTVFRSAAVDARQRNLLLAILIAPVVATTGYFVVNWSDLTSAFEYRPFSLAERLLTQAVVLVDYLRQAVAPQLSGLGIIHDDYPVSKGLLDPVATLLSALFIVSLVVLAIALRKKLPLVSLGILWFFAGHSLEAGPLPLELYFEHRNYLPLLGPLIVFAALLDAASPKLRRVMLLAAGLFIVAESFMTWQGARTWGNEALFQRTAVLEHPDSPRAQQYYVNGLIRAGNYREALAAQENLIERFPRYTSRLLSILNLRCIVDDLATAELDDLLRSFRTSEFDREIANYLPVLASNAAAGTCSGFGRDEFQVVLDNLLHNPNLATNGRAVGAIHYYKGIAHADAGELDLALQQLDLSYAANPLIDIPLQQTVWLLEANRPADAQDYLARARQHGRDSVIRRVYRDSDIELLQAEINRQIRGR